jgi:hypothetical protein
LDWNIENNSSVTGPGHGSAPKYARRERKETGLALRGFKIHSGRQWHEIFIK